MFPFKVMPLQFMKLVNISIYASVLVVFLLLIKSVSAERKRADQWGVL